MTPWTVACRLPCPWGLSRQEYWSGFPFTILGDHPNTGIEPRVIGKVLCFMFTIPEAVNFVPYPSSRTLAYTEVVLQDRYKLELEHNKEVSLSNCWFRRWDPLQLWYSPAETPIWLWHCCSVTQSLQPHGLQHTMLPCPSPSPRACSNSCPLSRWYHPTVSSSVIPFSSCFQSFSASGCF